MQEQSPTSLPESWLSLRKLTPARVALGRAGNAIPVQQMLRFKWAHAHAREAVYGALDMDRIEASLSGLQAPVLRVKSRAQDRTTYLQRPDWGRQLQENDRDLLMTQAQGADVLLIIADGLAAEGVNQQAPAIVEALWPLLQANGLQTAPIVLAEQARVALSDEIGALLGSRLALILIGERPGLSVSNSVGAYLTYQPQVGKTDEQRNCISNIHEQGLDALSAAQKMILLIQNSLRLQVSGVSLKEVDPSEGLLNG